jgi:PAS domain-containing protein
MLNRAREDEMGKAHFRVFTLPLLLVFCTLFYYFGELVDWAAWEALRREFFYGIHDIHRLLFLAPIIYAGYFGRVKGAIIVTLISFLIFMPRAFFISPFPDPLLRTVLFTLIAGVIGSLTGIVRNKSEQCRRLETTISSERDKLLSIVDGIADGVLITGPDYIIRFMNSNMVTEFGDGTGSPCYQHLHNLDAPCEQNCRIPDVINNREIGKWECSFPDGRIYEVVAAPYVDSDGVVCQLSVFRNITQRKKV